MINYDEREVNFEIIEHIGILNTHATGWTKELNLVRWNGGSPKYDIRDWDPNHLNMSRGITLQEQEMRTILELLKRRRQNAVRNRMTPKEDPDADYETPAEGEPEQEQSFESEEQ